MKYRVVEEGGWFGPTSTVTIKVRSKSGKVVKTIRLSRRPVNVDLSARITVPRTWATGTYTFTVYAKDTAGNVQSRAGKNRLVVR